MDVLSSPGGVQDTNYDVSERKKKIDISFLRVCLLTDDKLRPIALSKWLWNQKPQVNVSAVKRWREKRLKLKQIGR